MLGSFPLAALPIADDGGANAALTGAANLTGQGSISSSANVRSSGLTTLSGSGSIVSISKRRLFSLSNLSSTGSSTYSVSFKATGFTSLSGLGSLVPTAGFKALASSALSAQGSAAFLGGKKIGAASDIQAEGIFSAIPSFKLIGNFSGFLDNLFRLTESGDSRITESGDVRITEFVSENLGISSLVANPTYIEFTSIVYVKTLSAWSFSTIYANVSGQWVEPQAAYQRINGVWKRIN
tara:strand:+ start:2675 stop:3388 length:714 start_codon:yes stop_codon:yes gene_type:complete